MRLNTRLLSLPALFAITGVLAQQSASPTGGTPDVTYPTDDAFVFCSAQDCTGTCDVVNTDTVPKDDGEFAPNFLSIYWYDPGHYSWDLYTCISYEYLRYRSGHRAEHLLQSVRQRCSDCLYRVLLLGSLIWS
ncbi:hypothetical protein J3R82DRAFT_4844 [Butyriboletus roseoflavus]|nr:hypothetical protein J3R82DRAFT_4844 [Butyriboletus roseoflavus]